MGRRSTPQYNKIAELCRNLNPGDKRVSVTQMRSAGKELLKLLSEEPVRRRLAHEATPENLEPGESVKAIQRRAVAQIWRLVISNAIASAEKILDSKYKLTNEDVRLPAKLFQVSSFVDDLFDENAPALSKKEHNMLLEYCISMLNDDKVMGVDGAEKTLLDMLALICSKREVVAYFRPEKHTHAILEEIEKRIIQGDDDEVLSVHTQTTEVTAKILKNLLSTLFDLGFSLHMILPSTIKMIATWCHQKKNCDDVPEYPSMISAVAVLLRSSPDLAVASMERYGRKIFTFVRRRVNRQMGETALDPSLIEYLLRHLIVCQVAGKLQGLMPGDLGNVGSATLGFKYVGFLLEKLLSTQSKEHGVSETVSEYGKAHLELTVRLLACAQRIYIARAEWTAMDDPLAELSAPFADHPITDDYNRLHFDDDDDGMKSVPLTRSSLSESPFVSMVLRFLLAGAPISSVATYCAEDLGSQSQRPPCFGDVYCSPGLQQSNNPLLESVVLSCEGLSASKPFVVIAMLQVVSAACEMFPLGYCWASSTSIWHKISKDGMFSEDLYVRSGSFMDLVAVLKTVVTVLEAHGGHKAAGEVQRWALICLNKLAISTNAHLTVLKAKSLDHASVAEVWRQVWRTLLSPSMSYETSTKACSPGSNGDLVIRVLVQITRFACVDPAARYPATVSRDSFLVKQQADIWSLPAFEYCGPPVPSAFMLMYAVLRGCGLSDAGTDKIGRSLLQTGNEVWASRQQELGSGRRSKLLCFCLHYIERSRETRKNEHLVSIIIACISALVNGWTDAAPSLVFFGASSNVIPCAGILPGDATFTRFCDSTGVSTEQEGLKSFNDLFSCLWRRPVRFPDNFDAAICTGAFIDDLDTVGRGLVMVMQHSQEVEEKIRTTVTSIRPTLSERLFVVAELSLRSLAFSRIPNECRAGDDGTISGVDDIVREVDSVPWTLSSLFLRAFLTVALTCHNDTMIRFSEHICSTVAEFFGNVPAATTAAYADKECQADLFSDLIRVVRGLEAANAKIGLPLETLQESCENLYNFCISLLEGYTVGGIEVMEETATTDADTLDRSDDESDGSNRTTVTSGKKRRATHRTVGESRKQRKPLPPHEVALIPQCAYLVGGLLLSLNPVLKDCIFVARKLFGDNIDTSTHGEYGCDVWGGIFTVMFICHSKIIIGERLLDTLSSSEKTDDSSDNSPPVLICRIIHGIRDSSMPHSVAHLFGYSCCVKIISIFEEHQETAFLSKTEARQIVELLRTPTNSHDSRILALRPRIQVARLAATIEAFRGSCPSIHAELDADFGRDFVLPFLGHINSEVRRHGCIAVGVALSILQEDRVIESVRKRLCPIARKASQFEEWISNQSGNNDKWNSSNVQIWKDAEAPLRFDVLRCWSTIAASSSNRTVLQQIIFDTVRVVLADPTLLRPCFQMLEQIADSKGYTTIEKMLDAEIDEFARRWLTMGLRLVDFPIVISGPAAFRNLLWSGHSAQLSPVDGGTCEESPLTGITHLASLSFLRRHTCDFLPAIMIQTVATMINSSEVRDGRRLLLENESLKELCWAFADRFDDDAVKIMLENHFPAVLAAALLLRNGSDDDVVIADCIIRIVKGLLTDDSVKNLCNRTSGMIARRVLELIGQRPVNDDDEGFLTTLRNLVELCGKTPAPRAGNIFGQIGCTVAELLLFTRYRLHVSSTTIQMDSRWRSCRAVFGVLLEQMRHHRDGNYQADFPFHTFLLILSDQKRISVRLLALESLKEFVEEIAHMCSKSLQPKHDLNGALAISLFGTVLDLHRRCQNELLEVCTGLHRRDENLSRKTWGFIRSAIDDGGSSVVSNLPTILHNYHHRVCQNTLDCLTGTYWLLRALVDSREHLNLSAVEVRYLLKEETDPSSLLALEDFNQLYCAQAFINGVLGEAENDDTTNISALMNRLASYASTSQQMVAAAPAEIEFLLHQLETTLRRQCRGHQLSSFDIDKLSQIVLQYCSGEQNSENTKVAASRCLGELGVAFSKVDHDFVCAVSDKGSQSHGKQDSVTGPLKVLQAHTIERLARLLQSSDPARAMVAVDTLTALLSVRVGKDCFLLLKEEGISALLQPFLDSTRVSQPRLSNLVLEKHEIECLRARGGDEIEENEYRLWCWHISRWQIEPGTFFDAWICQLVPALIICNYGEGGQSLNNNFFRKCQRMSCIDFSFAVALFPAIILDLLLTSAERCMSKTVQKDRVLLDTWIGSDVSEINTRLSSAFHVLLTSSASSADSRFVEVATDVLDMLRRATQDRFMSSSNHKRSKSRPLSDEAVSWRGVPYGTVLKLDGALVTNAFIRAHRFEGALFYAELYADGRFRGSTTAAKVLALEPSRRMDLLRSTTVRDVSGFSVQVPSESSDRITATEFPLDDALENDSYSFLITLRACFANLEEDDCHRAVDRQISEFAFYGFHGPLAETAVLQTTEPSMRQLQKLDRMSFIDQRSNALKLSTATCLQGLGCLDTLGLYISGLWSSARNPCTFEESAEIREKWFYCRLFEMQWDDKLFRGNPDRFDAPEHMSPANLPSSVRVVEPPEARDLSGEESGFYERLVEALVTLRADDYNECLSHLRSARQCFINLLSLRPTMTTTVEKIGGVSSPMRVLNDMEDLAASADFRAVRNFLSRCRSTASIPAGYNLDIASNCVREVTLQSLRSKTNMIALREEITETLIDHLTWEFESCLNAGKVQTAEGILQRWYAILKSHDNDESTLSNISLLSLRLREATLFERSGDFLGAIRVAQLCARSLQDADVVKALDRSELCADAFSLCGKWTANHKVEPANVVLTSYLQPACEISQIICDHLPNDRNKDRFTDALLSQSELAFSLLKSLTNRVSSTEWHRNEGVLVNRKNELEELEFKKVKATETLNRKGQKKGRDNSLLTSKAATDLQDIHRVYEVLKSEYRIAVTERNDILRSIEGYRQMALRTLVTALSVAGIGTSKDLSKYVCRLVSMWFSLDNPIQLEDVDGIIEEAVTKIPSFRFVSIVKQIFSRLETSPSQTRLHQLVERMSRDHPYHCLAPLVTQSGYLHEGTNSKAQAASSILHKLAQDDSAFLGELIDNYRKLFHAYIHLISVSPALFEMKLEKPIPLNEVSKMASDHLDRCLGTGSRKTPLPPCVFTKPPLLRPGRDYGDKEGISDPIGSERVAGFENHFIISSSGLSKPKIVVCKGTQGGRFKQLLKGDDDTRQDAVMQQLFVYVNGLLARQPIVRSGSSGEEKLSLRLATYNVVPLNEQSGVIEWVDHCRAFKDYILDIKGPGGNSRYYPDEPSFSSCKNFFDEAKDAPVEVRLEVFKRILAQKSPVFRYFFVEKFGNSLEDWHASKLRYTRSVAVNSMVGHVFGIGDRHLSNMMVHQETGEVIHIDFGVVFERGKILRTPERIPFRMTQNIVDGMGPLGTEGTFTTAAITTLSTLRENTDSVLTLLSAVVADPFYNWNLATRHVKKSSTSKEVSANDIDIEQATYGEDDFDMIRVEGGNTGSVGEDQAERAIARIEEKLHGYEDGTSAEQQSVESQVQLLLNAAQDPINLCQMFGGWLPYV